MESPLEKTLTFCYKDEMILFMNAHPECFEEAVELAVSVKSHIRGEQRGYCGVS